jgi:hypothetical protein
LPASQGIKSGNVRFPAAWTIEDHNGACFTMEDRSGYAAYAHYEEEPARRAEANLMMRGEARRIAANIALPELPN